MIATLKPHLHALAKGILNRDAAGLAAGAGDAPVDGAEEADGHGDLGMILGGELDGAFHVRRLREPLVAGGGVGDGAVERLARFACVGGGWQWLRVRCADVGSGYGMAAGGGCEGQHRGWSVEKEGWRESSSRGESVQTNIV